MSERKTQLIERAWTFLGLIIGASLPSGLVLFVATALSIREFEIALRVAFIAGIVALIVAYSDMGTKSASSFAGSSPQTQSGCFLILDYLA